MIFFMQLDLQRNFDLPLKRDSHLLLFMCPTHNDVPTQLSGNNDTDLLPERYWEKTFGHYYMILNKPPKEERKLPSDGIIATQRLSFERAEEDIDWDGVMERGSDGFKVGGVPKWLHAPEQFRCACGSDMVFVLQLPANFGFPKTKKAPVQPDAVTPDKYCIFLGYPSFIFACKDQCTPYAVHAISQDPSDILAEIA
jgi:hypothetical protein